MRNVRVGQDCGTSIATESCSARRCIAASCCVIWRQISGAGAGKLELSDPLPGAARVCYCGDRSSLPPNSEPANHSSASLAERPAECQTSAITADLAVNASGRPRSIFVDSSNCIESCCEGTRRPRRCAGAEGIVVWNNRASRKARPNFTTLETAMLAETPCCRLFARLGRASARSICPTSIGTR